MESIDLDSEGSMKYEELETFRIRNQIIQCHNFVFLFVWLITVIFFNHQYIYSENQTQYSDTYV